MNRDDRDREGQGVLRSQMDCHHQVYIVHVYTCHERVTPWYRHLLSSNSYYFINISKDLSNTVL